jgi:enterochelin esterase family protein
MRVLADNPDQFAYVSIWSSGLFSQSAEDYVARHKDLLAAPESVNDAVDMLTIVCGSDDFALPGAEALAKIYSDHGIEHAFELTGGGHTWLNWRAYLHDFVPQLFR